MPDQPFLPILGPFFSRARRWFAYTAYVLALLFIITAGPLSLIIWSGASTKDDPELIFSLEIPDHFPWWTENHPSSAQFTSLFVLDAPNSRDDLFDPWVADFRTAWQEISRGRDTPETLERFPAEEFWERAAPLRAEIQALVETGELYPNPVPGLNPYDTLISLWRIRTFHRLTMAYAFHQKQQGQPIDDILHPMLWICDGLSRHGFHYFDFSVSLSFLKTYWELFPETILQNPTFREIYLDFASHWPERLQYTTKTEVLYLTHLTLAIEADPSRDVADYTTSTIHSGKLTWSQRMIDNLHQAYHNFIMRHHFLPLRTLNTYWRLQQKHRDYLKAGDYDQITYLLYDPETRLFAPNAGGERLLYQEVVYPTPSLIKSARQLAQDIQEALDHLD